MRWTGESLCLRWRARKWRKPYPIVLDINRTNKWLLPWLRPQNPAPVPFIVMAKVPAVAGANNVPEEEDRNTNAWAARVGLVNTLTTPEADRATVASVAALYCLS